MTTTPVRRAQRPDLDAITAAYLRYKMQQHIEAAEKAVAGYNHVDRQLAHRYPSPDMLRSPAPPSVNLLLPVVYRAAPGSDYVTAKQAKDLAELVIEARGETHTAVTVAVAAVIVAVLAFGFSALALWAGWPL